MKHSTIFKSRYMALLWAAGMIYFALDITGSTGTADGNQAGAETLTDASGAPVNEDDAKNVADALANL